MGRAVTKPDGDPEAHEEPMVKHARVVSEEGREIARPGFSTCWYLGEKGRTGQDKSWLCLNRFSKLGDRRESNPGAGMPGTPR
jgi:hypothetical protein